MSAETWGSVLLLIVAVCLLAAGTKEIVRYVVQRRWPVVRASIVNTDMTSIASSAPGTRIFTSTYVHTVSYKYKGTQHESSLVHPAVSLKNIKLRVDPNNPNRAVYRDGSLVYALLLLAFGVLAMLGFVRNLV